jgi:6,7-dimethyl-8-ribityllumazine synthase
MLEEKLRLLIIEGRVYDDVADALLAGASDVIAEAGAEHDVLTVPGALEIPAVVAMAEEGGHRAAGVRYDGYVALGCVIFDEGSQFEVAADECARGLMDLSIGKRLAIGSAIIAAEDRDEALAKASANGEDRGGAAARACLQMIEIRHRLLGRLR